MTMFWWIVLAEISVIVILIAIGMIRLIFLIKKTESTVEEFNKTIEISNKELPSLIKELHDAAEGITTITTSFGSIATKADETIGGALTGVKKIGDGLHRRKTFAIIPYLGKIKNFVTLITISYTIFNKLKNSGILNRGKSKRR